MHKSKLFIVIVGLLLLLTVSIVTADEDRIAVDFINTDGERTGYVVLSERDGGVNIYAVVDGLDTAPGAHGIHIHETGACALPDFKSAGDHYNPDNSEHGLDNPDGAHAGDGPNMTIFGGNGVYDYTNPRVTLAELVRGDGSAIVIHSGADDQMTDPAGDSGARIACAVIAGSGEMDDTDMDDEGDMDEDDMGDDGDMDDGDVIDLPTVVDVTNRWTNIYRQPDPRTATGQALPPGTAVTVVTTQGAWAQIESALGDGWIPLDAITLGSGVPVNMMNGLASAKSNGAVATTYAKLVGALESAEPISIVAEVSHGGNAQMAGLTLPPSQLVLFGNPMLGTPLMQRNQLAGLDLPQKMLVYQDDAEDVWVAYNSVEYLVKRHGLQGVATLPKIANALEMFAEDAAGNPVMMAGNSVAFGQGIIIKSSDFDMDETYARLKAALEANENITVIAELDHQQNAASVGMELNPTRLIVFGNPMLGTPLMQDAITIGIDLPQKMLVFEDEMGNVRIAYNNPTFLAERHGLTGSDDTLKMIRGALDTLADAARLSSE